MNKTRTATHGQPSHCTRARQCRHIAGSYQALFIVAAKLPRFRRWLGRGRHCITRYVIKIWIRVHHHSGPTAALPGRAPGLSRAAGRTHTGEYVPALEISRCTCGSWDFWKVTEPLRDARLIAGTDTSATGTWNLARPQRGVAYPPNSASINGVLVATDTTRASRHPRTVRRRHHRHNNYKHCSSGLYPPAT